MELEIDVNKLRGSVRLLLSALPPTSDKRNLEKFLAAHVYTGKEIDSLLQHLSENLLDANYTDHVGAAFEQCLLLILSLAIPKDEEIRAENVCEYQRKCVALAKLTRYSVDARRYTINYFRNKPAPFHAADTATTKLPKIKKPKVPKDSLLDVNTLTIVKCCYQLLCTDPAYFKDLWNWSPFVKRYWPSNNNGDQVKVYCNHIMAILTSMTATQLSALLSGIPAEVLLQFDAEQRGRPLPKADEPKHGLAEQPLLVTYRFQSELLTNIEGVLLPLFNTDNYKFYSQSDGCYENIVRVDSTKVNLRSIALGISSGKAICLSGPVGCGKTTLLEYLARKTGRVRPRAQEIAQQQQDSKENRMEVSQKDAKKNSLKDKQIAATVGRKRKSDHNLLEQTLTVETAAAAAKSNGFLRIQLGDQTDSKMLLGQYRCTDIPGEFIWLPGVLTQAVMNGNWLLLEDLDAATQDTYSILSGLLENNFLSVPGFRDCVKIEPGFQLFVTVRTNKSATNSAQKSLYSLLEKYLYVVNILPLSRNELCKVIANNYPKLATVANRIVDVFLTFSSGHHDAADNLRQQEALDKADTTEQFVALPFEAVPQSIMFNSGRQVSTRDLVKLCQRSNPVFSVTSTECAYFVFQNAVDVFCSYLPEGPDKTKLITSIGAKLGIVQSRCKHFAEEYRPEVQVDADRVKVGRAELGVKEVNTQTLPEERHSSQSIKRQKLTEKMEKALSKECATSATFSFTRLAACILERVAVCVAHAEPVLLVGETGVGKTSAVQYLAERTGHKLVVVNMNNQSDVSDLVGGFKPVDLNYVIAPLRGEFETLFRQVFNELKNETFLTKFGICYNQANFSVVIKLMLNVTDAVQSKADRNELQPNVLELLPRWQALQVKLLKLNAQLSKSINISFAFIPGSLVNCIRNGDWVLLDEINLASAETLECLSTILEPDGSVVLLERGDCTPVKRHPEFRIFACMNPNTDIGKKDLAVGIRNRFTEFFVDELSSDSDLNLLVGDYLSNTGIQRRSVVGIVRLYKKLKQLSRLELNDGLGNRPVFSLRTLCRSLRVCAKNLCGSIERNLYESFCMSFLTQLDAVSHNVVLQLIQDALLSSRAVLKQGIPQPGGNFLNFEGYWIEQGPRPLQECSTYILTASVRENLRDLARIIAIGKLPILLQGPTSAGKTSLIEYVAKRSGNHCLRINNHEHTDLQEYIGAYVADVSGKLAFKEGVLVQAMRNGHWIILDELNLASTDILEALNRVLDDNRELFIPETHTVVKAHPNFMLFATQNPPGLYGGRKTLSRAFKNRFIELHFGEIPRAELETILERRCLMPASYAKKMVMCMSDLQKNRANTTAKNVFTLRDLFRWGNRYTYADKRLLADQQYDWNQHLIEEGYLVLSAKVRTATELQIVEDALYRNFRKRIDLTRLFDVHTASGASSAVTAPIIEAIGTFRQRTDIVWTRNMTRMAVLAAKALQFDEPVLLVGPTGCGKTTICQILASIGSVQLRILNCHMHTEGADFLGGLRPCRQSGPDNGGSKRLFEWTDGPLIHAMQEGSYFMADEISLAEDSVLERLNCILEPERTVLLAEKGGVSGPGDAVDEEFVVQAHTGFQFLATMNPGGDFGKKELSPALRNRFTEIWCLPSDSKEDLILIATNCLLNTRPETDSTVSKEQMRQMAAFVVEVVLYIRNVVQRFKFSVRDILAWANYMVANSHLSFPEKAIFGLETIFLDALEMLPHDSLTQVEELKANIVEFAIKQAAGLLNQHFTLSELEQKRGAFVVQRQGQFGIEPFFVPTTDSALTSPSDCSFLFEAPTTKQNLFRLLSGLSLQKPMLLEGPPGVGKTSIVESLSQAIGYRIVRINLCEHTDLSDLFGTDLPADNGMLTVSIDEEAKSPEIQAGAFVWRDGPLLAALKAPNTWILLDELNLAPQSVLEGLNAVLDHRGEVYIPELNRTFALNQQTRIFAAQNPLKQGGGRKGLPQSFLNRFTKVYLRKLSTSDLLYVVSSKYADHFKEWHRFFASLLAECETPAERNIFTLHKKPWSEESLMAARNSEQFVFDLCERLVHFSTQLDNGSVNMEFGYRGGPYEINLRDILRWCEALVHPETGLRLPARRDANVTPKVAFQKHFGHFLLNLYERMKLIYYQRMRCEQDKLYIRNAFEHVFECDALLLHELSQDVALYWTDENIYLNDIVLQRDSGDLHGDWSISSKMSPLLLASQRELLKHIVECVHLEKPVLLCGATDTGKTKLIDTLCTLSHQVCNTDTIDDSVTGSYQQIDLNRHLEAISQQIEAILMRHLQKAANKNSAQSVQRIVPLLEAWSVYRLLANSTPVFNVNCVASAELFNFRQRIRNLNNVIELLTAAAPKVASAQLLEQKQMLMMLQAHTNRAESLNTGGSFEWVDSKIVKSLKCGQYMLLEHVNLCSSAVLDRLNPVFEPGGTLLVAEKGVCAGDNAAEVVAKAPNFRAFLTIDPKHGELSRAMRNRCIELALEPNTAYTVDDLRLIVHSVGVSSVAAINTMLAIHRRIAGATEFNHYGVSQLSQFAFLVAAYKRIGYELDRAIYVSGMEAYVYAAHTDLMGYGLAFYQNHLRDIVIDESTRFGALANDASPGNADVVQHLALSTGQLNEVTRIRQQLVPLQVLLQHDDMLRQQQQLSDLLGDFANLKWQDLEREQLLRTLVYMLYESSSMSDVQQRHSQLLELLQPQPTLLKLSHILLEQVQTRRADFERISPQLPWNHRLLPRIRDYAATENTAGSGQAAFRLSAALIAQLLLGEVPQRTGSARLHQLSALAYSQALEAGVITDKLNNTLLQQLSALLTHLPAVLRDAIAAADYQPDSYAQLISALLWFNRLVDIAQERLYEGKEFNTELFPKLVLHFKWLEKNLLKLLDGMAPSYQPNCVEYSTSLKQIGNYVLSANQQSNPLCKLYAKQLTHFQPFYDAAQIRLHAAAVDIDSLLGVLPTYGTYSLDLVMRKLLAQCSDAALQTHALLRRAVTASCLLSYKFEEVNVSAEHAADMPAELHAALQQFANMLKNSEAPLNEAGGNDELVALLAEKTLAVAALVHSKEELSEKEQPKDTCVAQLRLLDFYLTRKLLHCVTHGGALNAGYCESMLSLSSGSSRLIHLLDTAKYTAHAKVWSALNAYIDATASVADFERLLAYMNGSYRQFLTYHRLITHAVMQQQMGCLSGRFNVAAMLLNGKIDLNAEISSYDAYQGPPLISTFVTLLYQRDGSCRTVPLKGLQLWRHSLRDMRQLLWHNAEALTPTHSLLVNNLDGAQQNAARLLFEVAHVRRLCANAVKENTSDYDQHFDALLQVLDMRLKDSRTTATAVLPVCLQQQQIQYQGAMLHALCGAIELCLLTYTPPIDPVVKNRLKSAYIRDDITCLRTLSTAYDCMRIVLQHKLYGATIYESLDERVQTLNSRQNKYAQKVAERPAKCLYSCLMEDIAYFRKTNCEPQALYALLESVHVLWGNHYGQRQSEVTGALRDDVVQTQSKIAVWLVNAERFVGHTLKRYENHYQDFVQPLRCSVDQLRFGLQGVQVMLTQISAASTEPRTNVNNTGRLYRVLANIGQFPSVSNLNVFNVRSAQNIRENRAPIFKILEQVPGCELDYFRLLRAKLLELQNRISIAGAIDEATFRELDFALNVCNQIWQQEEERRRHQKAVEESLYVNKIRCPTEDEELLELQEIEEHFPTSVQEDFGDFQMEATLEAVMHLDKRKNLKAKCAQIVRDEDYTFIMQTFVQLMQRYTQLRYYRPVPAKLPAEVQPLELVAPFRERMQVFVKLYSHYHAALDEWMDTAMYNSFGVALGLQHQSLNGDSQSRQIGTDAARREYNFYKDANIAEIASSSELLTRIEQRVDEELALYPEHASLADVKRICDRIRTLPATAPVVRYSTGFQLLRQKIAQWNEVAHRNNHLHEEELEVAEYVQKWTRLELQFWRNCLSQTETRVQASAHKYWFFIYNLMQEYLHGGALDSSYTDMKHIEQRFVDGEIIDEVPTQTAPLVTLADVVRILRQFMEAASYGDYNVRMELLNSFEMYLQQGMRHRIVNAAAAGVKSDVTELIAGVHNLQVYFAQFGSEIGETKRSMRAPIEKKLKQFVKIESYNKDLSYFSMRNNVARVHRQLNKFLKEYQSALQQKITVLFQPRDATAKDYAVEPSRKNDKGHQLDAKWFVALPQECGPEQAGLAAEDTLLKRTAKLFATARQVVRETVENSPYPQLIVALDSLFVDQVARADHLRNLTVDRSVERVKQLSEAKHILQQKRKALSDLFKTLTQLGVSFKAGLMELSLRDDFEGFALAPFCVRTLLTVGNGGKRLQTHILQLYNGVDHYYAKCVLKLKMLQRIMLTPLAELGPPNIERIKGYAVDLFLLVQRQRELLADTSNNIHDLRKSLQQLRALATICGTPVKRATDLAFADHRDRYLRLKDFVCRIRYVTEQFRLLLACAPTEQDTDLVVSTVPSALQLNSPQFALAGKLSDEILSLARQTLARMATFDDTDFLSHAQLMTFEAAYDSLAKLLGQLRDLYATSTPHEYLSCVSAINELLGPLTEPAYKDVTVKMEDAASPPINLDNIDDELEAVLHAALLALQRLYKKYPQLTEAVDNEAAEEVQEQHLKKKLHAALIADWDSLAMATMNDRLQHLLLSVKHADATQQKLDGIRKLVTVLPLLEQYGMMAEYCLCQQLGTHRASVKMLSVMLTVFVELATKGFCVPADLMQDEEGQAKKEQKEGEGFGLEDGTGEKDASDKIESEDQLDDAKRPEDRKNDEDKKPDDDCKEEKGIEMSDNFEGKMQDIEKPEKEEGDSSESEEEDEMNKEMGETEEGAEKLDDQIWGDDEEQPEEKEDESEMNEEDGKGSKDEKDSHNDLNAQNEANKKDEDVNEHEKEGLDATNEPSDDNKSKQQEKQDIDNMKEPEVDEDQTNPYHNELEEPPEAEDMDLGDMNNDGDDAADEDNEQHQDENPFDIDTMKDVMQAPEERDDDNKEEGSGDEEKPADDSDGSDSEDDDSGAVKRDESANAEEEETADPKEAESQKPTEQEQQIAPDEEEQPKNDDDERREEKPEEHTQSKDKASKEENLQLVPETENKGSADDVQSEQTEQDVRQDQKLDEQETGEEQDGVGQAENEETNEGHQGVAETKESVAQEERQNDRQTKEKRKQGRTNEERTLGEAEKNKLKQLKTIDQLQQQKNDNGEDDDSQEPEQEEVEANEHQHVKEPKSSDKTTLDNATEEQSKQIKHQEDAKEEDNADVENPDELMEVDPEEEVANANEEKLEEMQAEKFDSKSDKASKTEKTKDRAEAQEEQLEVEGDIVSTMNVPRNDDTTAHCNMDLLHDNLTQAIESTTAQMLEMHRLFQQQLVAVQTRPLQQTDIETWESIHNRMSQNARELCEQLRLILEPTKCTRLKGDYRTGRRINMKKIIPYIASQFRKDKIWLRRTKPAQRDYKITIAIDDSKSMHHNNSKTLTLEAIALVSQALTLLESGCLSILSFGESPRIILNHTSQFDGHKLISELNFAQNKTKIAELLDFVRTANTEEGASSDNGIFENLLLILSDGRNIFSEGKAMVRNAIKLARLQRIFLVYIIIDNPENKNSILDIQTMEVLPDKSVSIKSYLDDFPFPYYVIVRDLNQLPLVLSEAMRQWFELVNSEQ